MLFNFAKPNHTVGNVLLIGPSNSGKRIFQKEFALNSLAEGTRIIYFDNDKGAWVFFHLTEGDRVDLGDDSKKGVFAPVRTLSPKPLSEFLITLVEIEKGKISPEEKAAINSAVNMIKGISEEQQTISGLIPYVMDNGLKEIFKKYAGDGIFNAKKEVVDFDSPFLCLECKQVFESGSKNSANILSYQFSRIESFADGEPIYIIFDDASLALNNAWVQDRLLPQINNLNKRNVHFIFAIHNISNTGARLKDSLLNQCGIRVYTPNSQVSSNRLIRESYQSMGLTEAQLDLIGTNKPRQDYIIQTADGKCQVIDLMIRPGSILHTLTGSSNIDDIRLFERLLAEHGRSDAIKEYLRLKGWQG